MDVLFLLLLILLNGVFAMVELAMIAARDARLEPIAATGDKRARTALELKRAPTRMLSTVQIGITSIGILNGIVGEAALAGPVADALSLAGLPETTAAPLATAVVVFAITYATIVLGELLPKRIAQSAPERIARLLAVPMAMLARIAAPFVWLLSASTNGLMRLLRVPDGDDDAITDEEIQALMSAGVRSGLIEPAELELVRRVFRLDDRRVGSFMTPRGELLTLKSDRPLSENLQRAIDGGRSQYPLVDDSGEIVAILHTRELLAAAGGVDTTWPPAGRTPLHVPETLSGRQLYERLHEAGTSAALVVDEYGDLQGLVTITDLLQAIAGNPEKPDEPLLRTLENGSLVVDGLYPALDLLERLGVNEPPGSQPPRYDTVGGMMQQLFGHLPRTGDVIEWAGWRFEIGSATRRRVRRVRVSRGVDSSAPQA